MSCRSVKSIGVASVLYRQLRSCLRHHLTSARQHDDERAANRSSETALHEGRRLLKRGRADQALVQLRNALNLYTAAKNSSGIAAAHNELGDLYLRQGQYPVALENYQKALDGFLAR